ncbi:MAG TPA: hypothetical protein VFD92_26115 [Candidatus Binatia bacterium]|nr:hypothetical protein [Candidatus Binatia bacterium]
MRWAIIDTDVYVGHWEGGLHHEALSDVRKSFERRLKIPIVYV